VLGADRHHPSAHPITHRDLGRGSRRPGRRRGATLEVRQGAREGSGIVSGRFEIGVGLLRRALHRPPEYHCRPHPPAGRHASEMPVKRAGAPGR